MKNENVHSVLKELLTDKITSKLIMLLTFLIIWTNSAAHEQHSFWYNGQGAYVRGPYIPESFWRGLGEYYHNYPRNLSPKLTANNIYVKTVGNSPGEKWHNKPLNDLEKMEESMGLSLPMSFDKFFEPMSLDTDKTPSNFKFNENTHLVFNPEKIGRNFETHYSSHINSKLGNENPGDLEWNNDFVSDSGYFRTYRDQASREIDNPNFRIVNSNGRGGGGGGRRQSTVKVSKRPTTSALKPMRGEMVVFPDWYRAEKYIPSMSNCDVKKDTLCESFKDGYPTQHISDILNKDGMTFKDFFGKDRSEEEISERINLSDESTLCSSRHEVIFPKAAKNTEDKWLFIINQDKYIQGISVELCIKPNTSCEFTQGFPAGYTPTCKQRYIERRMIALGEEGKIVSDSFWVPSCCVCVLNNSAMLPKNK